MSDAISKAISIIEDMQAFLLGRRVPEYDHLMIEESAEAINALQALQRSAEPVVFTCHGNNAPAYGCNKPGDMSGTYYKAPQQVVDRNELIELLIATRNQSEGVTADLIIKLLPAGKEVEISAEVVS
jgi:nicotinamidase-related amidase